MRVRLVRVSSEGPNQGPRDVTLVQRADPYTVGRDPHCDIILLCPQQEETTSPSTGPVKKYHRPAYGGIAPHHCSLAVDRVGNVRVMLPPWQQGGNGSCTALWINKRRVTNALAIENASSTTVLFVGQSISFGDSPHQFLYRLLRCPSEASAPAALGPCALLEPRSALTKSTMQMVPPSSRTFRMVDSSDDSDSSGSGMDDLYSLALHWSRALPKMMSAVKASCIGGGMKDERATQNLEPEAPDAPNGDVTSEPGSPDATGSSATKLTTSVVEPLAQPLSPVSTLTGSPNPPAAASRSDIVSTASSASRDQSSPAVISSIHIANSFLRLDVGRGRVMCELNGARLGVTVNGSPNAALSTNLSYASNRSSPTLTQFACPAAHPMVTQRGQRQLAKEQQQGDEGAFGRELQDFSLRTMELLEASFLAADDKFQHTAADADLLWHAFSRLSVAAGNIFKTERSFLQLSSPMFCCGDLHGSFSDLMIIARNMMPFSHPKYMTTPVLLLGDFVDRGPCSVEVVVYLLAWKVLCPKGLFLLRGNHEDPDVNGDINQYGHASFLSMCLQLFGPSRGQDAWTLANDCFQLLPLAAVIDQTIFACHGGIPRLSNNIIDCKNSPDNQEDRVGQEGPDSASLCAAVGAVSTSLFSQLLADGSVQDVPKFRSLMPQAGDDDSTRALRRLARELVWNDPAAATNNSPTVTVLGPQFDALGFRCNTGRGDSEEVILEFSKAAVDNFLGTFRLKLLIRAHQHKAYGVELSSGAKVITLFSSCNYAGENAAGACLVHQGEVRLVAWRRDLSRAVVETVGSEWSSGMLPTLDMTELPLLKVPNKIPITPPPAVARAQDDDACSTGPEVPEEAPAAVVPLLVSDGGLLLGSRKKSARPLAPMPAGGSPVSPCALPEVDDDSDTPVDQSAAICG